MVPQVRAGRIKYTLNSETGGSSIGQVRCNLLRGLMPNATYFGTVSGIL